MYTDKDSSEKGLRYKVNNYVSQMKVITSFFFDSLYFNARIGLLQVSSMQNSAAKMVEVIQKGFR